MTLTPDLINPLPPTPAPSTLNRTNHQRQQGCQGCGFSSPNGLFLKRLRRILLLHLEVAAGCEVFTERTTFFIFTDTKLNKNCSIPKEIQCCFCGWLFFLAFSMPGSPRAPSVLLRQPWAWSRRPPSVTAARHGPQYTSSLAQPGAVHTASASRL